MSKPSKRISRQTGRQKTSLPSPPSLRRRIVEWLLGITTLLGFFIGLLVLVPRITVNPEGTLNPSNPYPISFGITNIGYIPLVNVQPMLGICTFVVGEPETMPDRCQGQLGSRLVPTKWFVRRLAIDEKSVIRLDDVFGLNGNKFGGADISIVIRYQPWHIPIHQETEFRFVTRKENDGTLSWLPRPVEK
jgi:hypothetical protein